MKQLLVILAITILYPILSLAQDLPKARYLNVDNDKNIRKNTDPKLCLSCSDKVFIVDGNESFGYVELEFSEINSFGPFSTAELILNSSEVKYAESANGLSVFFNEQKIGSTGKISGNSSLVIKLNHAEIAHNKTIKLLLKANGEDGLYILSKKSGFGAVLKLQY